MTARQSAQDREFDATLVQARASAGTIEEKLLGEIAEVVGAARAATRPATSPPSPSDRTLSLRGEILSLETDFVT